MLHTSVGFDFVTSCGIVQIFLFNYKGIYTINRQFSNMVSTLSMFDDWSLFEHSENFVSGTKQAAYANAILAASVTHSVSLGE